jgi:hypothetical protein
MNQDAILNRPFIAQAQLGRTRTAIGGYLEANSNYIQEDGVTEGFSMEMRRFNIFLFSSISDRIRLISELEFEHGTEEIALETALLDFTFHHSFNFRAGIILPQLGLVNANHDSPQWEFIDRPLTSTSLIPTTLSEVGFGFFGKLYPKDMIISYDLYLVNGLGDGIVANTEGRTWLPAGKHEEMFAEDNNGSPMVNLRIAAALPQTLELGISYYGGIYNSFRLEGEQVQPRRFLDVYALDLQASINKLQLNGEAVLVNAMIPESMGQMIGTRQWGGFAELIYPVLQRRILGFEDAILNLNLRAELADYHAGDYALTQARIGDEVKGIAGGISFRPTNNTVLKAVYQYHWITDVLNNPPAKRAGVQFGLASYF